MKKYILVLAALILGCSSMTLSAQTRTYTLGITPSSAFANSEVTFQATFTNTSPVSTSVIHSLTLTPPSPFAIETATSPDGTVTISSGVIRVSALSGVSPGETLTLAVKVMVASESQCGTTQTDPWESSAFTGNAFSGNIFEFSGSPVTTDIVSTGLPLSILCPPDQTYACSDAVNYPSVTVTGGCGTPHVTFSPPANELSCGSTTVMVTATDDAAQTAVCQFNATHECQDLIVTCPSNVVFSCTDALVYPPVQASGCEPIVVTYSPPATSLIGGTPTLVTATVTDAAGLTALCTFVATRTPLTFDGFRPPINGVGGNCTAPFASTKKGRTLPIKFRVLCDNTPITSGSPTLLIARCVGGTLQPVLTGVFTLVTDMWQFNWDTDSLPTGSYLIRATLQDGSQQSVFVRLTS